MRQPLRAVLGAVGAPGIQQYFSPVLLSAKKFVELNSNLRESFELKSRMSLNFKEFKFGKRNSSEQSPEKERGQHHKIFGKRRINHLDLGIIHTYGFSARSIRKIFQKWTSHMYQS